MSELPFEYPTCEQRNSFLQYFGQYIYIYFHVLIMKISQFVACQIMYCYKYVSRQYETVMKEIQTNTCKHLYIRRESANVDSYYLYL